MLSCFRESFNSTVIVLGKKLICSPVRFSPKIFSAKYNDTQSVVFSERNNFSSKAHPQISDRFPRLVTVLFHLLRVDRVITGSGSDHGDRGGLFLQIKWSQQILSALRHHREILFLCVSTTKLGMLEFIHV